MNKRERLAQIVCCEGKECRADVRNKAGQGKLRLLPIPCDAVMHRDVVDIILDELMDMSLDPSGAHELGVQIGRFNREGVASVTSVWQAVLTHIKESRDE